MQCGVGGLGWGILGFAALIPGVGGSRAAKFQSSKAAKRRQQRENSKEKTAKKMGMVWAVGRGVVVKAVDVGSESRRT
jgi:orotidine-5'-phosphate decarboxylase